MNRTFSEWFCLPRNYTWKDFESEQTKPPDALNFFIWAASLGVCLLLFRNFILFPFVFRPIGIKAGVRSKPYRSPTKNEELEVLYKINRARPPRHMLAKTSAKVGWSERKVERWLRQKALSVQMTTLDKFEDFGWQFTYYTLFFITGLFVVVVKPYFKDPELCWRNYPFDRVTPDVWWYTVVSCAFYIAQTIILLRQDPRHDFNQMLAHHLITFYNFYSCVTFNGVRMLTISIFIHEIADIPLALGKLWSYSGYYRVSDGCFVVFCILWISTRIIMFPIHCLIPNYYAPTLMGSHNFPVCFIGQLFSYSFMVLHLMWTWELLLVLMRRLNGTDKAATDSRSSPDELSEEERDFKSEASPIIQSNGNGILHKRNFSGNTFNGINILSGKKIEASL